MSGTTWPPVSDALESSVDCISSCPNLSDGNSVIVIIDCPLQREVDTCVYVFVSVRIAPELQIKSSHQW